MYWNLNLHNIHNIKFTIWPSTVELAGLPYPTYKRGLRKPYKQGVWVTLIKERYKAHVYKSHFFWDTLCTLYICCSSGFTGIECMKFCKYINVTSSAVDHPFSDNSNLWQFQTRSATNLHLHRGCLCLCEPLHPPGHLRDRLCQPIQRWGMWILISIIRTRTF